MSSQTALKIDLQKEAFDGGAAASEGTMKELAGVAQHYSQKDQIDFFWLANGTYSKVPGIQVGVDGSRHVRCDCKIIGVALSNLDEGLSGTLEIDIVRHAVGGGSSSIFSTKPAIPFGPGDNQWVDYDVVTLADIYKSDPTITSPVVSVLNLTAGDMLTMNITSVQVEGSNATVTLIVQPT